MPVGDRRVADVLMGRPELSRRSLEEEGGGAGRVGLDDLPHGADEVRRDQRVLPGERGRVTRVVHDRPEHPPVVVGGDASHDERVVGRRGWD